MRAISIKYIWPEQWFTRSDRHGRRLVMVLPVLGHMVAILVYLANVFFWVIIIDYGMNLL